MPCIEIIIFITNHSKSVTLRKIFDLVLSSVLLFFFVFIFHLGVVAGFIFDIIVLVQGADVELLNPAIPVYLLYFHSNSFLDIFFFRKIN